MIKKMLINATHPEENRVAIVEDGILTELDIEVAGREQTKGNIYKATVIRVEPGLQAAFIDYGAERLGFLQMGEIHPNFFKAYQENSESRGRARINDILRRGQELLVQIVKEERGTKGAALTTYLSLPGRYMVFMPDSDTKGVSRKIEEESQRKKLKEAMASLNLPGDMGYIVRTAGIGQSSEELERDFNYLVRVYRNIQALSQQSKAPALIYKESNLVIRSIRDYFSSDMDEVLVDDPKVFQEAKDFFQEVMPEYARLVKLHQERRPIFARYQIEEQIETISKSKVPLPSGGSIVIDSTEALVAVDVNSGKMAGESGVEATAYKTNLEAATEVGRQLRLRDLGGLIVIDFIDMRDRKHGREVEKALKDALKTDKARVTVGRISQFGLLEMSRQRIKAALAEGSYHSCPHCEGTGRIKSAEAQAVAFMRKVMSGLSKGQVGRVEGEIPLDVATYLLNSRREELLEVERQHRISLLIKGNPDFLPGQMELVISKREKEEVQPEYVHATSPTLPTAAPIAPPRVAEPVQAEAAEEVEIEEETPTSEDGKKKRRRRRKKKKPGEAVAAGSESAAESELETPQEHEAEETAEDSEEEEEPTEAAASSEEVAAPEGAKKKRRRRRKKKPTSAATDPQSQAGAEEATAAPAPVIIPEQISPPAAAETPNSDLPATAAEAVEPPAKPAAASRPKRQRKPRPAAVSATEPVAATPAPATATETAATETAATETAVTKKPAGKRRAPAKKTVSKDSTEVGAKPDANSAAPATAEPAAPVAAEPAAKTVKTPKRKPAAKKPAQEGVAEEKAKPKRPSRKKAPTTDEAEQG